MPLILLDRDGVINEDLHPHGVTSLESLDVYPFAAEAVRHCNDAGWRVVIITNQSAIGKGLMTHQTLDAIHHRLREILYMQAGAIIDDIMYCPDHPDHPTPRRKPAPGMLEEALMRYDAAPSATPFIGDALRDLQAAQAAGCQPVLVATGKGAQTAAQLTDHPQLAHTQRFANVLDAVRVLVSPHAPSPDVPA